MCFLYGTRHCSPKVACKYLNADLGEKLKSWGKTKEPRHISSAHLLKAKPSSFSSHPRWPQKQSRLMNQKKAGYQMSWLINTHIAFCNGIQEQAVWNREMAKGRFSSQMSFKLWVCSDKFQEWLLHKFISAIVRHSNSRELAWLTTASSPRSKGSVLLSDLPPSSNLYRIADMISYMWKGRYR